MRTHLHQSTEIIGQEKLLLSRADLKSLGITYSNAHLLRLESTRRFPSRVRLSPGRVAWLKSEILAFIENRAAERINVFDEE